MMSSEVTMSLQDQDASLCQGDEDRALHLVLCQLPSGHEIFATYESCVRCGGTVLSSDGLLKPSVPTELVLCKLPSGGDIVTSKETCLSIGGTPIEDGHAIKR
jgi:hypothetical protein